MNAAIICRTLLLPLLVQYVDASLHLSALVYASSFFHGMDEGPIMLLTRATVSVMCLSVHLDWFQWPSHMTGAGVG